MKNYQLSPSYLIRFCILAFYTTISYVLIFSNSAKSEQLEHTKVTVFFEGGELAEDVVRFYRYLYNTDPRLLNLKLYSNTEHTYLENALLTDQIILRGNPGSMLDFLCVLNPQLPCSDIKLSKAKTFFVPSIEWKKYTYPQNIIDPWINLKEKNKDLTDINIAEIIAKNYGASLKDVKRALSGVDTEYVASLEDAKQALSPVDTEHEEHIDADGDLIHIHTYGDPLIHTHPLAIYNGVVNATGYRVEISLPSKDVESKDSDLHKIRPNNVFVVQNQEPQSVSSTYKVEDKLDKNNCEQDFTDILGTSTIDLIDSLKLEKSTAIAIFEDDIDLSHCDFFDSNGKSIFFHDKPLDKTDCNSICENSSHQSNIERYHGTHIAGIIGARLNQVGIIGVNPLSRLLALSTTNHKDIADNITKAFDKGVKVANMSNSYMAIGYLTNDIGFRRIKTSEKNILFVSAAGNTSDPSKDGPLRLDPYECGSEIPVCLFMRPNVLTVTALTTNKSGILNNAKRGNGVVHIAAPGENILSTIPDGSIAKGTGTSQAAALVTGTASILFALDPSLSPEAVKNRIMYTADMLPELNKYVMSGKLNIKKAIENIHEDIVIFKNSNEPHYGCIETVTKNTLYIYSEDFDDINKIGHHFALNPRNIRRIVWMPGSNNYTFMVYKDNELKRYSGYRFQPKNVFTDNKYQDVSKHFLFNSCDSTSAGEPLNLVDVKDFIIRINR